MFEFEIKLAHVGGWAVDFTRLMLISTQIEVIVGVGIELSNNNNNVGSDFFSILDIDVNNFCGPLGPMDDIIVK